MLVTICERAKGTQLSEGPVPDAKEIAEDAQLTVQPLIAAEFEALWRKAVE
ncbi:DUF6881 domain-containing protein [Lysobacter sp. CA199]|uniref:DUF6881 domain-containing protein n=1 Tax=Lysobacter sp. CA199 TaxID=3455608 RepID=UPI003F8D39B2